MESLPAFEQARYKSDFRIADVDIANGRVAATSAERDRFWHHWCGYVQGMGIDPYLQEESYNTKVRAVTGFGGRVRTGYCGHGNQVTCARVQTAIRAIGQTCELDLGVNPLYRAHERYLKQVELMFAGFKRDDPIPVPEIAVPVSVPEECAKMGLTSAATEKEKAVGDLAIIAFFYLLRVGEYTQKKRKTNTRTIQFRYCDVAFKQGGLHHPT